LDNHPMNPAGWKRFLARMRRLPLRLRKVLSGGTEGLHPSKLKGSGLTFVENRPYVPGDDPRAINWPLTARLGEPVIKRFEASRELILWLVVDPSPSMFLGDPVSPLRWALEICGAASATINAGKDRLGLLVPGDGRAPALRIAPKRGRVAGLRLLETLASRGPSIPTPEGWQQALGHWGQHGKGHRLWILSNGAGLQGLAPIIKPLAARHRVVWFRPENPHLKHTPNWPDPEFAPTVERVSWDIHEDPVLKLGAWMKGGGA
ncbi:MAG TPA: DUF58 domain-containing protein, partial [Holophaga sp.]|nr:DUF58 domain-containing protein [Holophaga sp.]